LSWGKTFPAAIGRPAIRTAFAIVMLALIAPLLLVLGDEGAKGAAIAYSTASAVIAVGGIIVTFKVLLPADPPKERAVSRQ
jgi:hypothetical protein